MALARAARPSLPSHHVLSFVAFKPSNPKLEWGVWDDQNGERREAVCAELFEDFSVEDHAFVRYLFCQEAACCEHNETMSDELKRCAFMLASLGQSEDVFILYAAKSGGVSFDAAIGLDWEMVLGADPATTIEFVRSCNDERLRAEIPGCDPNMVREEIGQFVASCVPFVEYEKAMREYFSPA